MRDSVDMESVRELLRVLEDRERLLALLDSSAGFGQRPGLLG
jgi:hypothetical protein